MSGYSILGICLKTENRENVLNLGEAKLQSYLAEGKRLLNFYSFFQMPLDPFPVGLERYFLLSKGSKKGSAEWMGPGVKETNLHCEADTQRHHHHCSCLGRPWLKVLPAKLPGFLNSVLKFSNHFF